MSSTGPSGVIGRTGTEQEKAEAVKAGASPKHYLNCRKVGATHAEVLEALGGGASLYWCADCRKVGATHAEVIEALGAESPLGWYSHCRWTGTTHAEVLEARGAGAGLAWYAVCRTAGATHAEATALRLTRLPSSSQLSARLALSALGAPAYLRQQRLRPAPPVRRPARGTQP